MGPFVSLDRNKFILVTIDYMSKCVEDLELHQNDGQVWYAF